MRARELGILLLAAGGCTTSLYPGPKRPASEIATLRSHDMMIDEVDGRRVRDDVWAGTNAKYEVAPGPHIIGVSVMKTRPMIFYNLVTRSGTVDVCIVAQKGHTYLAEPMIEGKRWQLRVLDQVGHQFAGLPCPQHLTLLVYDGPRRAEGATAIVQPLGLGVHGIDGQRIADGLAYKVAPGTHVFSFHLDDNRGYGPRRVSKQGIEVCLVLQAGHTYFAAPDYEADETWRPLIADEASGGNLATRPGSSADPDCTTASHSRAPARSPSPAPGPVRPADDEAPPRE